MWRSDLMAWGRPSTDTLSVLVTSPHSNWQSTNASLTGNDVTHLENTKNKTTNRNGKFIAIGPPVSGGTVMRKAQAPCPEVRTDANRIWSKSTGCQWETLHQRRVLKKEVPKNQKHSVRIAGPTTGESEAKLCCFAKDWSGCCGSRLGSC